MVLDTDFEVFLPTDYINNVTERLSQYQKLAELKTEEELAKFSEELIDRFGSLPDPTLELFDSVRLKWLGTALGFEKIILKKNRCICRFHATPESLFYQQDGFQYLLQQLAGLKNAQLKEKNTKVGQRLVMVLTEIPSIAKAIELLKQLTKPTTA